MSVRHVSLAVNSAEGRLVSFAVAGRGSVPATSMPVDFVLRTRAVWRIRLANVEGANRMADGGIVDSPAGTAFAGSNELMEVLREVHLPASALSSALHSFGSNVDKLVGSLEKVPSSVTLDHGVIRHDVIVNGTQAVAEFQQGMARTQVVSVGHG